MTEDGTPHPTSLSQEGFSIMQMPLAEGWTVHAAGGPVPDGLVLQDLPATVPGCVHLDLMAAQVIPDPYLDENEAAVAWVGDVDWRYCTEIDWAGVDPTEEIDLVAEGLDTLATIELNGSVLAETANMHRSYRFPVKDLLQNGRNELAITFGSAVQAAHAQSAALGPRPHVNTLPYNSIRKMACNLGWDWGPILVTAGIWRPVRLETWRTARIRSVRPLVDVEGSTGVLTVHIEAERQLGHGGPLTARVQVAGIVRNVEIPAGSDSAIVVVQVSDVALWWPHGYGEQPLYDLDVTLLDAGVHLTSWHGRVGFRTVALLREPDADGTPFTVAVNGRPVFARGVNWIPDDCFPSRIPRERYAERLSQAKEGNINLLRVWGGGIYESEDFYDLCDELGLLVWQDFLLACAAYAEEQPLRGEIEAEAREAVTRLSPHPSLVLWNGGNENLWGYEDWGWKDQLAGRTWGLGYYHEILPAIVAELDPTRPYSPGSPYSPDPALHPNDPTNGTMHIWDVWNQRDYLHYRDYRPRFASEFGFQGPPSWATLTRSIHDDPLTVDSPGLAAHQKAEDGNGKLSRGLQGHLPEPSNIDDWHWATSLNQARAVATGVEHLRSLMPLCMGSILWQLNDCWPVTSWAAIDGDGRCKPLWYALRQSYQDRLLTIQPRDGGLVVAAVNDSDESWQDELLVSRVSFDGSSLAVELHRVDVAPRSVATVHLAASLAQAAQPASEVLLAQAGDVRAWWHFAEVVDSQLPVPVLDVQVDPQPFGYRVSVLTHTFVRDLALLADRAAADAVVDDMLVTLLPGESVAFDVRTAAALSADELSSALVLRSANQLVHAAALDVV